MIIARVVMSLSVNSHFKGFGCLVKGMIGWIFNTLFTFWAYRKTTITDLYRLSLKAKIETSGVS